MRSYAQYGNYKKPSWAPPAWLFGPVWTLLYVLIAISFGYVGYLWSIGIVPFVVLLPFVLNLCFNFAFTPIQFGLRNYYLAAVDVILVWITLAWAMYAIAPIVSWVAYMNIPYITWVSFATVLQLSVTAMNRK